jgi:hypothetical protein
MEVLARILFDQRQFLVTSAVSSLVLVPVVIDRRLRVAARPDLPTR